MPSQLSGPAYVLGELEGPAARVGFWAKMAAALGATQLIIGTSCIVFHVIAFLMDQNADEQLHYMGEGILTGGVVSSFSFAFLVCKLSHFLILAEHNGSVLSTIHN